MAAETAPPTLFRGECWQCGQQRQLDTRGHVVRHQGMTIIGRSTGRFCTGSLRPPLSGL